VPRRDAAAGPYPAVDRKNQPGKSAGVSQPERAVFVAQMQLIFQSDALLPELEFLSLDPFEMFEILPE
jgi:hypothetical protein